MNRECTQTIINIDYEKMKKEIEELRDYANNNIIRIKELDEIATSKKCPVGDRSEYTRIIGAYKIVYSVDEFIIDNELTLVKRASVSLLRIHRVNPQAKFPSKEIVKMIIDMLGFPDLTLCQIKLFDDNDNDNINAHILIVSY